MSKVSMDREGLHRKLDEWLDAVAQVRPSLEDGESMSFKLEGYRDGHHGGEELIGFTLTTSRTESSL